MPVTPPFTPPFTPRPPVVLPPCWCGRTPTEHTEHTERAEREEREERESVPDHEYVPADGFESEAFDAW